MQYTSKEVYEYICEKCDDSIIEWKKCCISGQEFPIYKSDLEFYNKVSPTFEVSESYAKEFLEKNNDVNDNFEYKNWKLKAKIPTPNLCPEERYRRKIAFRNEWKLYKRTCNLSWKSIVSSYSPDKTYTVYNQSDRWSDKRNPLDYAMNIDIHKSFLEQFKKLFFSVPMITLLNVWSENSEYCTLWWNNKNCYLIVWNHSENCCYWRYCTNNNQNCFDFFFSVNNTNCYEIIDAENCYEVFFSQWVKDCKHSYFLTDCENCSHCFGCTNLKNKEYYIYNKPSSKQDFEKLIKNLNRDFIEQTKEKVRLSQELLPIKNVNNLSVDEKSIWNNLSYAENVYMWFDCHWVGSSIKDCKYIDLSTSLNDCYDVVDSWSNSALCYETLTCMWKSILFSSNIFDCDNILYSNMCQNCSCCFGCVGLSNKKYCILNKQYTKEEYNELVPQIISQMMRDNTRWAFFPSSFSPFWYNETIAMEYYPLTKQEALDKNFNWSDYEAPMPHVEKKVQWKDLPKQWCKTIKEKKPEILDKVLNYAIICEVSQKPFRIIKQEIDFYTRYNIPLPTKCSDVRHLERTRKRAMRQLYKWVCDCCGKEILYAKYQQQNRKVYCQSYYLSLF